MMQTSKYGRKKAVVAGVVLLVSCGCSYSLQPSDGLMQSVSRLTRVAEAEAFGKFQGTKDIQGVNLNLGRVTSISGQEFSQPVFIYNLSTAVDQVSENHSEILGHISKCINIETLRLAGLKLESGGFLQRLIDVRVVDLSFTDLPVEELLHLKDCRRLEELNVAGNNYDRNVVEIIKQFKSLRVLKLDGVDMNANDVENLLRDGIIDQLFLRGNRSISQEELVAIGERFDVEIIYEWPKNQGVL